MAHSKSFLKTIKTDAKKRARNRAVKSAISTFEKKFLALVDAKDFTEAAAALQVCFSAYDKAAKKNIIKKEKADRKKSRLALRLNKAQA
jgi:small subunit ribosomal protein S20